MYVCKQKRFATFPHEQEKRSVNCACYGDFTKAWSRLKPTKWRQNLQPIPKQHSSLLPHCTSLPHSKKPNKWKGCQLRSNSCKLKSQKKKNETSVSILLL